MGVERIRSQPELETIGPQPTSPVSAPFTMSLRERKKGGGEKETSSRPSGARKFCPKFSNITIPSLFFLLLLSVFSFLEKEPVFLIARANAFLLALHLPRPTHDGARKARRTQDEERVWHARADFSYKNGLNNAEIYLFSGINHREFYDSAYIT